MRETSFQRLGDVAPKLERILNRSGVDPELPASFDAADIRHRTVRVSMRDGVCLATDLYLPPVLPAPTIAWRTPYGRAAERFLPVYLAFARHGYAVIAQDCRGTGGSEPEVWDYCIYEAEDSVDCVEWVTKQDWFGGQLFSFGGSYVAMTQWCMAAHPRMTGIAPEVAGLRITRSTARQYMFVNGYPRVTGKGANRLAVPIDQIERVIEAETMSGGFFNAPLQPPLPEPVLRRYPQLRALPPCEAKRQLWAQLCSYPAAARAELLKLLLGVVEFTYTDYWSLPTVFDCLIPHGVNTIPSVSADELCRRLRAPALFITGWYDWNLGDTLPTWTTFQRSAGSDIAARSRLIVTPAAHHAPGYREGQEKHPELRVDHRCNVELLLQWYRAVRDGVTESWPKVIYYLLGANEWRTASAWPVPEAQPAPLYLGVDRTLSFDAPRAPSEPDRFTYDPAHPTPTVGGSVLSFLYPPGSVDVSEVQRRSDVLTYTTAPLQRDLDVVGPLSLVLFASSSAVDTDFVGRLSDVFPDGRALQLQSGILRARYRNLSGDPELLQPGRIYRFEIDLWATANRFKAGHRLRLDICSADFPRFDRNSNRGGGPGEPIPAEQAIYHDPLHPSHLLVFIVDTERR